MMGFLQRLRNTSRARAEEWNGYKMDAAAKLEDILYRSNELGGEAGEVCNAVKKLIRFTKGMKGGVDMETSRQDIADELADVLICVDRVAESLDIDLEEAVANKFNKTSSRYGLSVFMEQ